MSAIYIAMPTLNEPNRKISPDQRMEVVINIRATVLDGEVVRRKANAWLLDNVGNLLSASTPEFVLGERLMWRYEVILGIPNLAQPGSGALYKVGQMLLDAETGEVVNPDGLIEELQTNAAATEH